MKLKSIALFLFVILIWIPVYSSKASEGPSDANKFSQRLDKLVPKLLDESLTPGAAIAIIQNGQVIFKKGYGYADVEKKQLVTPQTGFNIGSISKTVAAWGVMRLVEQGKLELDTPVEKYLKRWHLPETEFDNNGVTVRRLLSHTAGLSLHGYPGFGPDDKLPSVEESLSGKTNGSGDVHLIMEPGTKWKYSGGGYTLSQLLVEEITDQVFADYMREQVLRPLGMQRSDYRLSEEILAGSSVAYDGWGDPTPNPRFTAEAAAGLHTIVEDLATFAAAALAGPDKQLPGRNILKPETIELMLAPAPASNGTYGLGYSTRLLPNEKISKGHGGSNRGWQAYFQIIPESRDGIVIVTNSSNGSSVHRQVFCAWTEWLTGETPERGCEQPIRIVLISTIVEHGIEAAVKKYRALKTMKPNDYIFSEGQLNNLGYQLMGKEKINDAIEIFKLNVEAYPEASNPYDSLGEAYMKNGNKELAIKNYKKSLELNPDNTNAVEMLKKIENQ